MEFVSSLVESLAWPISIVFALTLFRLEIIGLFEKLTRLKYKDLELDFSKVREYAQAIQGPQPGRVREISPVLVTLEDQILDTVDRSPGTAILLAWSALETTVADAVTRMAIPPDLPSYKSPRYNIELLERYGGVPTNYIGLLNKMRTLRNKVAHQPDALLTITQDQAMDYAQTAINMMQYLADLHRAS